MAVPHLGLAALIDGDLPVRWIGGRERLPKFLNSLGLTGNEHSQSLYIFPKIVANPTQYLNELRDQVDREELWAIITGTVNEDKKPMVIAFPVSREYRSGDTQSAHMALFIEVHSRLVSWWLVNAWRSRQLADATWGLGDSMQIIPAAACARSLLETAASFWIETKNLHQIWSEAKRNYAESGPNLQSWQNLRKQLYKMVWAARFDNKVPDLEKTYGTFFSRMNVLTQIEKLARAASDPVQRDYQWLCNAVHPSVGGMLAFAAPLMAHDTMTCAFQYVSAVPTVFRKTKSGHALHNANLSASTTSSSEPVAREATIQTALARAAVLAVEVLEKTLDDALKIIDDIGLTTKAPKIANFNYWRNTVQKKGNVLCPCRSGRKAKHCLHQWTDVTPSVVDSF